MLSPGAYKLMILARLEKDATPSASVVALTLTDVEIHAGALIPVVEPAFPVAITVATLLERRLSIADLRESVSHAALYNVLPPRLIFADAI